MADDDESGPETPRDRRARLIFIAVAVVVAALFLEVLGWMNGGGLLSLFHAHAAIRAGAAAIDIDSHALLWVTIAIMWLSASALCALFGIDPLKGAARWVLVISAIGGFILDISCDEAMTAHYAVAHDYRRCPSGDVKVGHGRGGIWFDHYVLARLPCPPRRTT